MGLVKTEPGSACHYQNVEVNFYQKAIIMIIEVESDRKINGIKISSFCT